MGFGDQAVNRSIRILVALIANARWVSGLEFSPEKSPLRERIATTVVTLQSEVDDSPRSFRVTSLATEQREVKVIDITALFGDRANTGCICEGSKSAVMAKT